MDTASTSHTPAIDELTGRAARSLASRAQLSRDQASTRVAVVTCMDARLDPWRVFGLARGEANVIRNGGGVVTDDVIRSLLVSQRVLGTREVLVVQHTRCGMTRLSEEELTRETERDAGLRLPFPIEAFPDAVEEVRHSLRRLEQSPYLVRDRAARGFVYDVDTEELTEVDAAA